ncbi:MAG: hypothetical protein ABIB43_06275 [archaeon]
MNEKPKKTIENKTDKTIKIINTVLEALILILAVVILLTTSYNYLLVLPLFPMFFFFKIMHWYDKKHGLKIPQYYYTLGLLTVYLSIGGEFFLELYYRIIFYDKILHFFNAFYLSIIVSFILKGKIHFKKTFVLLIIMGIGAIYELLEYGVDSISGTTIMQGVIINVKNLMGGLEDTMKDLTYAFVGSITGIIVANKLERKKKDKKKVNS